LLTAAFVLALISPLMSILPDSAIDTHFTSHFPIMQASPSFPELLQRALASPEDDGGRNPSLIPDAINSNYFQQAAGLWRRRYPSKLPITDCICQRLLSEVSLNQPDLTALILELLFAREVFRIDPYASAIPPSNYLFVFVILVFELRKSGLMRVPSPFQQYFPLPGSNPKPGFYSVFCLAQHLAARLRKMNEMYHPKKTAPTTEFLVYRDRTVLTNIAAQIQGLSLKFQKTEITFSEYQTAVVRILSAQAEDIAKIRDGLLQHQISLQIRNDCMALCGDINGAAIAVASDFINPVRFEPDIAAILADLEVGIRTGVGPIEGCFLAEAWGLIHAKVQGQTDGIEQLEQFEAVLLGFEDDFHDKTIDHRALFNACIAFPRQRDINLNKRDCQTGTAMVAIDQALSYALYLLTASLVETMETAERLDFLRVSGICGIDTAPSREAVNIALAEWQAATQKIQAVVGQMKGLPFIRVDLAKLAFTEELPPWRFPASFGMDGITPAGVEAVRVAKTNAYLVVQKAMIALQSRTACLTCGQAIAVKICDVCQRFVTCEHCQHVCPPP
jgi:hypothetical protein